MAEHEIPTLFLLLGLLFPRISLLIFWLTGSLPYNTTPLWSDALLSMFFPRALFCWWIYDIQGYSGWFWIFFISLILSIIFHTIDYMSGNAKKRFDMMMEQLNRM